jgi:hypothetical protein
LPLDEMPAALAERLRPLVAQYAEGREEAWTA